MTSIWPGPHAQQAEAQPAGLVGAFTRLVQGSLGGSLLGAVQVGAAFASGERDANRLADVVFNARHPERRGRPLGAGETQLGREWLRIRDVVIVPALRRVGTAPAIAAPPPAVTAPGRYTLPADPAQLRPAPRTQIRAQPLFPGDNVLAEAVRLITTEAARPDGWVYLANWYAAHRFAHVGDTSKWLQTPLATCARAGARIRALFWSGSLHSIDPLIRSILGPLAIIDRSVATMVESMIRQALVARFTNYDVNRATAEFINALSRTTPRADAVARLDDSTLLFGSHHQKILVVGNNERTVAVVGGVDWHENRLLQGKAASGFPLFDGTPYFDISVRVDGAAAEDLADLFERRWQADTARTRVPLATRRRPKDVWPASGATVQIGPNFGCGRPFTTVPHAIRSGSELIANLFRNCQTFFYAEDQYGVGNDDLERAIKQAFANGARYGVVVLANGLTVSDIPEIAFRRHQFWSRFSQIGTKLFVFERVGDDSITGGPHAYVHSKFVLVDDRAASIASVNMNRRSWYHDSELATVITDAPELIRDLRVRVWREHLTLKPGEDIRDPVTALNVWQAAYNGTRTMLRVRPVSFAIRPPRKSADIGGPGSIVGTIVSIAAGPLLDAVALRALRNKVDEVLDLAYDQIIDPPGRMSC